MKQKHNFKCPKCGDRNGLCVVVEVWAALDDDGTDIDAGDDGSHTWDGESSMSCECGHRGPAKAFLVTPDAEFFTEED